MKLLICKVTTTPIVFNIVLCITVLLLYACGSGGSGSNSNGGTGSIKFTLAIQNTSGASGGRFVADNLESSHALIASVKQSSLQVFELPFTLRLSETLESVLSYKLWAYAWFLAPSNAHANSISEYGSFSPRNTTLLAQTFDNGINCEIYQINKIIAYVYDEKNILRAESEPIPCHKGEGSLSSPVGKMRLVINANNNLGVKTFEGKSNFLNVTQDGTTNAGTITLKPFNQPPMLNLIDSPKTTHEGQPLEFNIEAKDHNINNILTYSASNLPPGANFDPDTQKFDWVPGYGYEGTYTVTFEVTDNGNPQMKDSKEVLIEVVSTPWLFTTLDSEADVGRYSSIGISPVDDSVHISYYKKTIAADDLENGKLKYAEYVDGFWHMQELDDGDETTSNVGILTSLVIDSTGKAHISYFDDDNKSLRYTTGMSESWLEVPEVVAAGSVSGTNSIALDSSNNPHISFRELIQLGPGTISNLRYAKKNASGLWENDIVDSNVGSSNSIAVDPNNDNLHISYYDSANENLKYAKMIALGQWERITIDNSGDVGHFTSIAVDNEGDVHISYYDQTIGQLKYATNTSGSWLTQTVDNVGDVGSDSSISIDSFGGVHISYYDRTNKALKYATNASGSWKTYIVDESANVGMNTSIALDSSGNIHISYFDEETDDLKYARRAEPEEKNLYPVLTPIGDKTIDENEQIEFSITAMDPNQVDMLIFLSGLNGEVGELPTGATFVDNLDGTATFSWTPSLEDAGNYNILFAVLDNGTPQLSDIEVVTITVINVNQQPQFNPIDQQDVPIGQEITFQVSATDPDENDILTYSADLSDLPPDSDANFDPDTQIFSWTPQFSDFENVNEYAVEFTVTDNGTPQLSDTLSVTFTHQPPEPPQ